MAQQARPRMTVPEFLSWDDGTETHYELIRGEVYAMTAPTVAHGVIAGVLGGTILRALAPPCRLVHQAAIALPDDETTCYEADLAVTCAPHRQGQRTLVEPVLIVEVQSPSTAAHDRLVKLDDYRRLASVQEILYVSCEWRTATLFRRDGARWLVEDFVGQAGFDLRSVGCRIELAEVYAGLEI